MQVKVFTFNPQEVSQSQQMINSWLNANPNIVVDRVTQSQGVADVGNRTYTSAYLTVMVWYVPPPKKEEQGTDLAGMLEKEFS